MIPLIAEHTDQIADICRRHHVKRLDVFGSAAVGDFKPDQSDLVDDTAIKNPYFRKSVEETREQIYAA